MYHEDGEGRDDEGKVGHHGNEGGFFFFRKPKKGLVLMVFSPREVLVERSDLHSGFVFLGVVHAMVVVRLNGDDHIAGSIYSRSSLLVLWRGL